MTEKIPIALVIDDAPSYAKTIECRLGHRGVFPPHVLILTNAEDAVANFSDPEWLAKYDVKAVVSDYDNSRQSETTGVQLLAAANEAFPDVPSLLVSTDSRNHRADFLELQEKHPHVEFQLKFSHDKIGAFLDIIRGGTDEDVAKGNTLNSLVPLAPKPRYALFENDAQIFASYLTDWQNVIASLFGDNPFKALEQTKDLASLTTSVEGVQLLNETEIRDAIKRYHGLVVPSRSAGSASVSVLEVPPHAEYSDAMKCYQIQLLTFWNELHKADDLLKKANEKVEKYIRNPKKYRRDGRNNDKELYYDLQNHIPEIQEIIDGSFVKLAIQFAWHGTYEPVTDWVASGFAPGVNNAEPQGLTPKQIEYYRYTQAGTINHAFKGLAGSARIQLVDTKKSINIIVDEIDKLAKDQIQTEAARRSEEGLIGFALRSLGFWK